jgi:hypothetical protein
VLLLHRPDAFGRDHPQAGEAEIIIGKRQAGPTETITVASQLHLSRFGNMASGDYRAGSLISCGFSSLMSTSQTERPLDVRFDRKVRDRRSSALKADEETLGLGQPHPVDF